MTSDAKALQAQGVKLYEQQDYEAAARVFKQASDAFDAAGQPDMAAEMQTNIGLVHRALGEHQQALDTMQQALETFKETNDTLRLAQVFGNMGGVYLEIGDKEQAYNCYRQAADGFLEVGERKMYGETMLAIAKVQFKDGKIWPAAATYEVGLEYLDRLTMSQKVLQRLIGFRNRLTGSSQYKPEMKENKEDPS
jgi:tetratricopeptide (TPR) repeat protein